MLAVRNLSVTVKKTGLTMKTLEALLAKYPYKAGDKVNVSPYLVTYFSNTVYDDTFFW